MPDVPDAERLLARFREEYIARSPFREDRALADELLSEARPAAEALVMATDDTGDDLSSLEHYEGLAMVSLLGRRAAQLRATPTAALGIVPSLCAGLAEVGTALDVEAQGAMLAVCIEGYVAAREERLQHAHGDAMAEAVPLVRVAPKCVALFLSGDLDADHIAEIVDRFGRALLREDAAACIVSLGELTRASRERAAAVFGADAAARMLGCLCVFSDADEAWTDAARASGADLELLAIEATFEAALARALERCGLSIKRGWLPGFGRR